MQPSDNGQQQSQLPYGQRPRTPHQPTPSRPGTPSPPMPQYYPRPQSPPILCPVPTGPYPALRPPFANYQRPGTPGPGGGSSGRYHNHPVAAPNTAQPQAHPRYPPEMNQYPPSRNRDSGEQQFIPTPSQAMEYRQYTDTSRQSNRRSGSVSSPLNPGYNHPSSSTATHFPPAVPPSQHYPSQYASTSAVSANYTSTSAGDRFVCSQCDASFSRPHDRRRHYETQHLESPPVHRCRYCQKEFTRADSLKRHLNNGCEPKDDN